MIDINTLTIGIEEEYMICNSSTYELENVADKVIPLIENDLKDRYSYELILSEIESNTSICHTVREAVNEVSELRRYINSLCNNFNCSIGISGTHPTSKPNDQKFVDNNSYRWVKDQLNYYALRNLTFSQHVHIGIPNKKYFIPVLNSLRRWIPSLLAISTNSPFFEGVKTGMLSSRTFQFGSFPRTNIADYINDYDSFMNIYNKYKSMESIMLPRHIWWKIRPHIDYGTIEFRICDAQRNLENVSLIAAISQALVYQSIQDYEKNTLHQSFNLDLLNDGLWKASRFDHNAYLYDEPTDQIMKIREMIGIMENYCAEALALFGNEFVHSYLKNILDYGSESSQQLHIYEKGGFQMLNKFLVENVSYTIGDK